MKRKSIIAAIIGNIIEWYDFSLYIYLAPILAQQFFNPHGLSDTLLLTFFIFSVSYFIRPLGSILLGHLGDTFGRAITMKITVLMISLPTLGIGLLPNFQHWGIAASISFAVLRLLQGFCIGGEFAGSMIYLTEIAPANKRAFISCMTNNGSNIGFFLSSLIAASLSSVMSPLAFQTYGWRLPFIIGGCLGLIGLWLRRDLEETPIFHQLSNQTAKQYLPILTTLKHDKKIIWKIFQLLAFSATGTYILMNLMSTYLHEYFHYTLSAALKVQTICNASTFLLVTLSAILSDYFGRRTMLLISAFGYIIFSLPCYYFLQFTGVWLYLLPLVVCYSIEQASIPVTMVEMFPAAARYTGLSLAYNLAIATIGGTAPLLSVWLIKLFHQPIIFAFYLMIAAIISGRIIFFYLPTTFGTQHNLLKI